MKEILLLLSLCFLFSCVSSEKEDYDSLTSAEYRKDLQMKRNVAYLEEISQLKESSFEFISKQMKDMIQDYERMKGQLKKIERKLDQSLNLTPVKKETFQFEKETNKNNIVLTKKNKEQVVVSLYSIEDYTRLMAQILRGEYDISEEEKEKLLTSLKKQMTAKRDLEDIEPSSEIEFIEIEDREDLDGDSLLEEDKTDEFEENQEDDIERNREDGIFEEEEDTSSLISAKKHFQEQSYETAISEFQKYRNKNPDGAHYSEATFYIGESFEKLKMPIEAKVFFKEIVQSHPKSLWASRAKKFLKK